MASAKATRVIVRDWIAYTTGRFRSEVAAGLRTSHDALRRDPGPVGSRRMRIRHWRRTRPFWGGLLLIFAGIELILIPLSGILLHGAIKLVIYIGIGGVFGVLIGVLLIASGLLLWLTPMHRTFYAIAGVVLAIASFIASNLGGFFLGMLLGITGGSLAFAWSAGPAEQKAETEDEDEDAGRHRSGRLMASAAMPAVLIGSLLTGHSQVAQSQRPRDCILGIICWSPSPAPTQPPAQPSDPAQSAQPPLPGPSPSGSGQTGPASTGKGKTATTDPGLAASTAASVITAGSATLNGLAYQGTAKVPVAGGTQTMMKFTLDSLTLSGGVTATVTQDGQTTVTQSSSLAFSGGVTLYATKLSGNLLGIGVTLTPGSVVSILLQVLKTLTPLVPVTMTNVTTDQPFVLAGALQADNLEIAAGSG